MTGPLLPRRGRLLRPGACGLVWLVLLAVGACSAAPSAEGARDETTGAADAPEAGRNTQEGRDGSVARGSADASTSSHAPGRDAAVSTGELDAAPLGTPQSDDRGARTDASPESSVVDAAGGDPAAADAASPGFVLTPVGFPMYGGELTFPPAANPPTNASPEFTWSGVPLGTKSLALVFRDLGNGAVKWILWDIPPMLTRVPPALSKVAKPPEVPGSSQLGSLDNQGYAGPGMGSRQYDFKLWALDVEKLPVTARLTTLQIHDDVLPEHDLATTAPVLLRNTRNLP